MEKFKNEKVETGYSSCSNSSSVGPRGNIYLAKCLIYTFLEGARCFLIRDFDFNKQILTTMYLPSFTL